MTIPGRGDLAPRRRSSYGRRQRRWPRVLLTLIVIAALAAGGYFGWQELSDNDKATVATGAPCPTQTSTPTPTRQPPVTTKVLNGSLKAGLAKKVAKTLHQRFGVTVAKVGNAPRFTRGVSVVHYPPRLAAPARTLAGYVVPRARLQKKAGSKKVELDIGTRFRSVAPPPQNPAPAPSPSTSPCGTS
jgi:hypothetical protein